MENLPKKRGRPRNNEGKGQELTQKQRAFVTEYQKDYSGTDAVIRAKFNVKNRQSAAAIAYQLLHSTSVSEILERESSDRLRKIGVHAERILTEDSRIAFFDPRKLFKEDGTLKPPKEWDDDTAAAIAGIEIIEGPNRRTFLKKIKINDKGAALDRLHKREGLAKQQDAKVSVGVNVVILKTPLIQKPDNAGMSEDD